MAARYASVVSGSSRGLATTLSPTHAASYPASSAWRAIASTPRRGAAGRLHDGATRGHEDADAHQADRTQPPCTGWCCTGIDEGRPAPRVLVERAPERGNDLDGLSTSSL